MTSQMHFLDQLHRTVTPHRDRPEPALWFKELRLLDRLDLAAERRKIILHRGLNILWAKPEDPNAEQGLYRDGLAGHASGKTLFCRILRHLLGEEPFGTRSQREGIQEGFLSLWAVASVRLNGRSWVVGRPLATDGEKFAVETETIEEAVATPSKLAGGYGSFMAELSKLSESVEPLFPGAGWRHLLPWLARDQEARFSSLASWREAISEGENPQTKAVDRHQIMRAVLGLLDPDEPALRRKIENSQSALESLRAQLITDQSKLSGKESLAKAQAKELLGGEMPEETKAIVARLESLAEVLREGTQDLSKRPPTPAVVEAQKRFAEANKALTLAESELARLDEVIPERKARLEQDLTVTRKIKNRNVVDPTRAEAGFCPRMIEFARERGCYQDSAPSADSALSIAELEARAAAEAKAIAGLETTAAALRRTLPKLRNAVIDAHRVFEEAMTEADRELVRLTQRATRAETIASLYRDIATTRRALTTSEEIIAQCLETLESDKAELTRLRRDMENKVLELSNIFADVIHGVMGSSVEVGLRVTSEGIEPHVSRGPELSGAALDTIKTLAFDLAAVIASIEGKGNHPRFLIHDGPREGDMARVIYDRFFLYAAGIEASFTSPDAASFQYILTTTTPPPARMREGSRWLLELVLDSRHKERRLLMEDF